MSPETISMIIKWGPLALVSVVFLWCFFLGVIRGTYKVVRRMIYVVLYVVLVWFFIDQITNSVLSLNITINGIKGIRPFIVHTLESNETIRSFLNYSPNLYGLIIESPEIIVSPVLFLVLIIVVLPLSFPIYWIYLLIFNLIAKFVFHREKYEKDEDGEILRNDKGKKIKIKRKKQRLLGGFLRGAQGVVLICLVLLPVNMVNRIYNKAKKNAELSDGETICGTNKLVKGADDICKYLELYNQTIFAKMSGEKSIDKMITDKLITIEYDDIELNLEEELKVVAVSLVLLNDSGIMDLFDENGSLNLATADFSVINFNKLDLLLDTLFSSTLIREVSDAGTRYVLNEVLKDDLVKVFEDDDIVSKLEYENADSIKKELKDVVGILKFAIEKNLINRVIDNKDDAVSMVNNLNSEDVETLINKILSLKILSNAMPSIVEVYGTKYGVETPSNIKDFNEEIAYLFANSLKLVQTLDLVSMSDLTEGNMLDNIINALFENGALKSDTKDSLATLLNDLNQSHLFKNVLTSQINKLLEGKDYKVDARVLKYVDNKEAWLNELSVLDRVYSLYSDYKDSETVNYSNVTNLLDEISGTKVILSVMPFAYDELLPKVGIEVDSDGFPVIDFDGENENASKQEFYNTWEAELKVLKNVADAIGVLELQSLEDISVDLLNNNDNVDALATVMGEIYTSKYLKEPFVDLMKDTINEFIADFDVEFTSDELLKLDTKEEWRNEFANINTLLSVDMSDSDNITGEKLTSIFVAIGNMKLFDTKKIEILKYVVKESDFLTQSEYDSIAWPNSEATQEELDAFWDNETSVLVSVVEDKEIIESLSNASIEDLNTNDVGGVINTVMTSEILSSIVVNKVSSLLVENGIKDDRDVEGSVLNLNQSIRDVEDWKLELAAIKEMVNISEDDMGDVAPGEEKNAVEKMFDSIEASTLLQNTRANLLLKAIDTIGILEEIPSDVTVDVLKANDYEKYNHEKNVIIDVSKNKDAFDELSTMELETMDTDKIGELLNVVTSSIIFEDYVSKEISTLLVDNDVRDDRDSNDSVENLTQSIKDVEDWKFELLTIKNMITSLDDIITTAYLEIDLYETYDRSGEEGNYTYTPSPIGSYIKVDEDYYLIESAYRYNKSGEVYEQDDAGIYLKVSETKVDDLFLNIESSQLLRNTRANLLLKSVDNIGVLEEIPSEVTVTRLANNNYELYNKERDIIVEVSKNKNAFDNFATMELDAINTDEIGGLLNTVTSSIIFEGYVVDQIKTVFITNGINDDSGDATKLETNIASVNDISSWKVELAIIKDMLTMTSETFDDVIGGKTKIDIMFENIEASLLLRNTRANILIKAVNTVGISGVSVPTDVDSVSLSANSYEQYDKETAVLKTFARNVDAIDGLGDNIATINTTIKIAVAELLDDMKYSKIFKDKYVSTVDSVLENIESAIISSGYNAKGVSLNRSDAVNGYVNIDWANEINSLSTISANIEEMSAYNKDNISENKEEKIATIGSTLEAIESSAFLGASNCQIIANSVISAITDGSINEIEKPEGKTWTEIFNMVVSLIS